MSKIFENYIAQCPNCGAELDSTSKFCSYCGTSLQQQNISFHNKEQEIHKKDQIVQNSQKVLNRKEADVENLKNTTIKTPDIKFPLFVCALILICITIIFLVFMFIN